jgi:hypothetical protein
MRIRPDFIIAGAPRCGTTFLVRNLQAHPDVCFARGEEDYAASDLHFFDRNTPKGSKNYAKGEKWYLQRFTHCNTGKVLGEKTADYLVDPDAAKLIRRHLGAIRLVFLLRDPVERAYSHYWHSRHRMPLSMTFSRLVQKGHDVNDVWILHSGFYWELLNPFIAKFGVDNVHILIQEDLETKPREELKRVCQFLRIDEEVYFPLANERINAASSSFIAHWSARLGNALQTHVPWLSQWLLQGRLSSSIKQLITRSRGKAPESRDKEGPSYPPISRHDRFSLQTLYHSDVTALSELLGRDMAALWWGENQESP